MQSKAATVAQYLAELSADRRAAIDAVRAVILKNLDKGYREVMQYGMIGYCVPHEVFPDGYHCDPRQPLPYASIAAQKNACSLYLMAIYGDEALRDWFVSAWKKTGKKLDMGQSCIRFKSADDLALDVIAEAFRRTPASAYVAHYQRARGSAAAKPAAKKKGPAKKTPQKKVTKKAGKKVTKKKATKR